MGHCLKNGMCGQLIPMMLIGKSMEMNSDTYYGDTGFFPVRLLGGALLVSLFSSLHQVRALHAWT